MAMDATIQMGVGFTYSPQKVIIKKQIKSCKICKSVYFNSEVYCGNCGNKISIKEVTEELTFNDEMLLNYLERNYDGDDLYGLSHWEEGKMDNFIYDEKCVTSNHIILSTIECEKMTVNFKEKNKQIIEFINEISEKPIKIEVAASLVYI